MANKTLVAALTATTFLVSGVAMAADQGSTGGASQGKTSAALTNAEQDFGKVSHQGSRAYQDMALTRLAIFEGQTAQAKKLVAEADGALTKAKSEDAALIKAEAALPGFKQAGGMEAKAAGGGAPAGHDAAASSQAWLPVYSTISVGEDLKASPGKRKALDDANASLRKGDRKGAFERLKVADVGMKIVEAVLPLEQSINDVHQASALINDGKYFEGSQLLRKVEASARFNVSDYTEGANGRLVYSHVSDLGRSAGNDRQLASSDGPEPYSAPDPQYAPMKGEPTIQPAKPTTVSLTDGQKVGGPAAGPEPYAAQDPQYKPMGKEPVIHPSKAAQPSLSQH